MLMTNHQTRPVPRPGVLDIEAYVPGKSAAAGVGKTYKLSSNETPIGPSPAALDAFLSAASDLALYPDGAATLLRMAIGRRFGIDPTRIVCGNGSDDLLHLLAGAYLGPGDEGIYTEHGFLVYRIAILAAGGTPVVAPEVNFTANVDSILARVTDRTKIVYLANPNNPTGTYLPFEEIRRLHAALSPGVLLVLDAAYAEYVRPNDYSAGLELAAMFENVVMTRTFSKIHGLAALRVGWMFAPAHVCDALHRIRGPFNLNSAALLAAAASIEDTGHLEIAAAHNAKWLDWLSGEVSRLGLTVTPSVANFLLIHFPPEPGKSARDAEAFLTSRGIVVRGVGAYGLPEALRVTIGTEEANRAVVAVLSEFVASGSNPKGGLRG